MSDDTRTGLSCLRCQAELRALGSPAFRIGGTGGLGHLFLGNWADLGESTVEFVVLGCPRCGHVELMLPEKDRDRLARG